MFVQWWTIEAMIFDEFRPKYIAFFKSFSSGPSEVLVRMWQHSNDKWQIIIIFSLKVAAPLDSKHCQVSHMSKNDPFFTSQ